MRARCTIAAVIWLCLDVGLAAGQQGQPAVPGATKSGPIVEASQLDTFMLRDSKGNLVPVLGLPFEEFEQLLRAKKGLNAAAGPTHTIEALSIVGRAVGQIAELQVTATIRMREAGWVKVPLGLGGAAMRGPGKYEGPGEHFLAYDDASGELICWLKMPENGTQRTDGTPPRAFPTENNTPHVLTLQVAAAVKEVGGGAMLSLTVPRATESSLRVATEQKEVEASLTKGEGIVSVRAGSSGGSEITVLGPGGELQLTWQAKRQEASAVGGLLEVAGEISVRVFSERRISSEARLRVRSNGGSLETFRVKLPTGMELIPLPLSGGYSVTPVADQAEVVQVRFDRPINGPTEVVLRVQREADREKTATLMPAQFEVLEAVRQRGMIEFLMEGEWQLDWTEDNTVHRLEPAADAAANVVARYEYFQQPCGLELNVSAPPSRVTVEPSHVVYVDADRVRIETTLKYRFRGARTSALQFDMGGWTFDRLTPESLLDLPVGGESYGSDVRVPFRVGGPAVSELELKLEAHRTLPPEGEPLTLALPRPIADFIAPSTVVISAADNIDLTPRVSEMVGLSADAAHVQVPGRQQPGIVYRDLGGGEEASFVAGWRKLTRLTTTAAQSRVRIDRAKMHVEQRLQYRIAHEPQRTFELVVPREVASASWQVRYQDEPLTMTRLAWAGGEEAGLSRWQFTTPKDQMGACEVTINYSLPLDWDRKAALPLGIPHVVPVVETNSEFAGQQVEFVLSDGATIEPDLEGVDELASPIAVGSGATHAYSWSSPANYSRWTLELGEGAEPSAVSVSQMWVQSWVTSQIRQERVAMRIRTNQEVVRIRLPRRVRQASVQTAIDGQEQEISFRVPGLLVVAVPPAIQGRECVLEVCFSLDPPDSEFGVMNDELRTAQVEQAAGPRRFYWQLVLPGDLHLISGSQEMASEMAWSIGQSTSWLKSQRPIMDQRQLEAWIKSSRQELLPQGANEYLFGGLGEWPTLRLVTAQRRVVVSVASGGMLALGLLLMYVPWLRSAGVLAGVAVLLAAMAVFAPELALLGAQAGVLGVVVMMMAAGWLWITSGESALPGQAGASVAAVRREGSSLHGSARVREPSSRITTTAGPGPLMEARP